MNLNSKILGITQVVITSLMINAQTTENKLPGDPTLVSSKATIEKLISYDKGNFKYKVEDYFARPKASQFKISPDGLYLSYKEKDKDSKNHVYVKDLRSGKITKALVEKDDLIRSYGWLDKKRLFYTQDKGGNENIHLYAADIDGKNLKDLTPFEGITLNSVRLIKDTEFVIVSMNKNNKQIFEPYKINFNTGEITQLYENKDVKSPIDDYLFDRQGNLRGYTILENGLTTKLFYKDLQTGKFNLVKATDWKDTFSVISFNDNSKNKDEVYLVTNLGSDKSRIVLYDLKKNAIIKEVYSNPTFDVSSIAQAGKSRNYELDYISYNGIKNETIPVSKFYKEIHDKLTSEFGDKQFGIASSDDKNEKLLVVVDSDKLYGKYYEYDTKTKTTKLLFDLMPQLKEEDMAEMRPIQFKSRDGLTIHGYITLPKAALNGEKVPLIVNPHGGPQGIRDDWGFNPETQLFASRGYATLQVNFRISGGYGKEFQTSGYKQIGRKAMDDVEDGVKYAIEQGWIDKNKVAIYGGSHGGYATLMGLIKTPDLYSCGVDYVGVSNIFTFFDSFPEYWKPYKEMVKQIWYDLDNPEEAKIAKEVSPVFQIDKIKKPLFVVQGANDPRVNINESDQIVKALRSKGFEVPYMVKYDEGHGFGKEPNRIEFYKSMLGFFAENFNK
ncbi:MULTISPECIES: S9 family peptidase [Chryseobacterium]|uniref:Dipeptidyl aminopeptidase/acylaminoacyl peptidase n=2 Tax=Chryseobacterium TaxID=59732 RepID=A0AAX2IGX5_9FLAO|nr:MULTISPECIES: S9 family peptidase [Chryseobacterium]AZB28776.1 S9 family peptidase [Chryseobacterium balustinum]SIN91885.1 Dipeptidyl aminopeptidase/acylaminoacyl peptidase [Chryseobacterium scophthalmum]SKB86034.1 Dipeptidyl aminopeptidase/acylaminoacyl peptidase [Chryseobacterium balustinum]SQA87647.1 Prolyl tripeptidyl peptidase precursor [Chryseobacterium balustinum]VXB19356.1 Dipeptidyl aminopeptidase/acylaminoacyl peptidase [Chryseobacterium sp. 8AT]